MGQRCPMKQVIFFFKRILQKLLHIKHSYFLSFLFNPTYEHAESNLV
jgi:hypothetical protein